MKSAALSSLFLSLFICKINAKLAGTRKGTYKGGVNSIYKIVRKCNNAYAYASHLLEL